MTFTERRLRGQTHTHTPAGNSHVGPDTHLPEESSTQTHQGRTGDRCSSITRRFQPGVWVLPSHAANRLVTHIRGSIQA